MISLWVVNSINHPEFKRTFVTSFLHPFFNSITIIPTYIATLLNLLLINLCCPSPSSRSIIFNLPPSPPPLSLLSFLSSLPPFHLRLFQIRLFFGRRHKGRVIGGEIRLWGRLLSIGEIKLIIIDYLTQTEVNFKIEVMLNFLENFSTTSLCVFTTCSSCIMHAQITQYTCTATLWHIPRTIQDFHAHLYVPWAIQDLHGFIVLPKGRIDYIRPLGHIWFSCIYTSLGPYKICMHLYVPRELQEANMAWYFLQISSSTRAV